MATNYENNIKANYIKYVRSYVSAVVSAEEGKPAAGAQQAARKKLCATLVGDLMRVDGSRFASGEARRAWIGRHKRVVLARKRRYRKNSVYYDVHCSPHDYVAPMVRMTRYMEEAERPLDSVVPMHITLDTTGLVRLFDSVAETLGQTKRELLSNLADEERRDSIWSVLFRTEMKIIRGTRTYAFNHMVKTDGVSCCVVLRRRRREAGSRASEDQGTRKRKSRDEDADGCSSEDAGGYSGDGALRETERAELAERLVVGIDPGKSDLLYCCAEKSTAHAEARRRGESKKCSELRYTQNQRRQEMKTMKYREIVAREKRRYGRVGRASIAQWEKLLSTYNHKTVSIGEFEAYIEAKLLVNSKIAPLYARAIFRKLRLGAHLNKRRSEERMVKRFKEKFGAADKVVIGFGDGSEGRPRRGVEATACKGVRGVLRRRGYRVLLIDEYGTSCMCSACGPEEEGRRAAFLRRKHPDTRRSDHDRGKRLVHGLLKCQLCKRLWNRDVNAAINIARLTRAVLNGEERAAYLRLPSPPMAVSAPR